MIGEIALIGRVLLSVAVGTAQKQLTRLEAGSTRIWRVTYAWMAFPALLAIAASRTGIASAFYVNAIVAGLLDALGNLAMVAALRGTDLSVFAPLNGFRPVLAFVFAWAVLGEHPSAFGAAGVGVTVIGAMLLLHEDERTGGRWSAQTWRMLGLRTLGLLLSTFAAVFLKRATLEGSTGLTLGIWVLCGVFVFSLWHPQPVGGIAAAQAQPTCYLLLAHAAVFFVMQWLTLEVFRRTLLAYSFALFQLGIVLQVFIGHWLFKEANFRRRLLCCGIIGAGTGMILSDR